MDNKKDGRVSHGMYGTRMYRIWASAKARCNNINHSEFELYGARGITFFDEWNCFEGFYEWAIVSGYQEHLSIDRIDTNGMYEPDNCKWSTPKEQANNRRSNIVVEYRGETKNLKEWAEKLNINYKMIWSRLKSGWDVEKAFNKPPKGKTPNVQTS